MKKAWVIVPFLVILHLSPAFSQDRAKLLQGTPFESARIQWQDTQPSDMSFTQAGEIPEADFFLEYAKAFRLGKDYEFRAYGKNIQKNSRSDQRYKQYFRNIEVAETFIILHSENQLVRHVNGNPVHALAIETRPTLSIEKAEFYLNKLYSGYVSRGTLSAKLSKIPLHDLKAPCLMISAGDQVRKPENFHLVYRFDLFFPKTQQRFAIDIDAHSGELVGKLPRSYDGNIETQGMSLYNNMVDITIMDEEYESLWDPASWHLTDWNAYGGSGTSWWIADIHVGSEGGYRDSWLQAIETDAVALMKSPVLTFYHRYAVEAPSAYEGFDGWDGMNVQISVDGGQNWSVLDNPSPAYTKSRLFSFYYNGQGDNIPGWCGEKTNWTLVTVPLDAYAGKTVKIRFVFAADGAYSTMDDSDLFGWQIDNILIGTAYENQGSTDNMTAINFTSGYVAETEGNYRLRETSRGNGIATFNGEAVSEDYSYSDAVDYVEDDTLIDQAENMIGVSVHWALEKTYDYFLEKHGRSGFDGNGGLLRAYTGMLFDGSPNNASYIGGGQMLFGNGDGTNYGPLVSLDITAHELTHGLTGATANLNYINESGALNESFSDIFGKTVDFYAKAEMDDWWMGDDIAINAQAFRLMSNPNLRLDPDTYLGDFWITTDGDENNDNGGVHTNSGVMNYWYYLLCEGGSGTNDDGYFFDVTPVNLDDAAQIAFRNLTAYLVPSSEYVDAASYSIRSAEDLFGEGSQQVTSVMQAWEAVGIYADPTISIPESLTFTISQAATAAEASLEIRNKSISPLEITSLRIDGEGFGFAAFPSLPLSIEKMDELALIYDPGTNNDPATGSLTLATNDPDQPEVSVVLTSDGYDMLDELSETGSFRLNTYPNPFTDELSISFYLSQPERVTAFILNPLGEKIRVLDIPSATAGENIIHWDGTNDSGMKVPSGNYYLLLHSGNQRISKVINIVKQIP
ncbi:MAG: M4 family metallopeptidase [Bacteroidales bacterium]|nr:M4 family metallopeptidase [Bacteroidales bacterium]